MSNHDEVSSKFDDPDIQRRVERLKRDKNRSSGGHDRERHDKETAKRLRREQKERQKKRFTVLQEIADALRVREIVEAALPEGGLPDCWEPESLNNRDYPSVGMFVRCIPGPGEMRLIGVWLVMLPESSRVMARVGARAGDAIELLDWAVAPEVVPGVSEIAVDPAQVEGVRERIRSKLVAAIADN